MPTTPVTTPDRLAWLLQRHPSVLVIVGAVDFLHIEEYLAAGAMRLSEADLARLDAVHAAGS